MKEFLKGKLEAQRRRNESRALADDHLDSAYLLEQQERAALFARSKETVENAVRALAEETREYSYTASDLKDFLVRLIREPALSHLGVQVTLNQYNNFKVPKDAIPFGSNNDVFVWVKITEKPSKHLSIQYCHNGVASRRHHR